MMSNIVKNFDMIATSILHSYFDNPTKLFSNLYLAKFLNTSTKPFFVHIIIYIYILLLFISNKLLY